MKMWSWPDKAVSAADIFARSDNDRRSINNKADDLRSGNMFLLVINPEYE